MTNILLLSALGIAALLAEIVLPGGILGAIGGVCLLGAVVLAYLGYGPVAGGAAFAALLLLALACLGLWMRLFNRIPFTRRLVLDESIDGRAVAEAPTSLVGRHGVALTDLVPSGRAEIDGTRRDVVAEGSAVARGDAIIIIAERGPSLVVRRTTEEA
jgi:membrane-bound serine protease (ClpP class)